MRGPAVLVGAAALLTVTVVASSTGVASAGDTALTLPTAVPTIQVTVPPLPLPTPSVSVPPVPKPKVSVPPVPSVPPPPGGGGGGGGGGDESPGGTPAGGGTAPGAAPGGSAAPGGDAAGTGKASPPRSTVKPMIAGRPEAQDVLDQESSPALYNASKRFLAADDKIAALSKARDAMDAAREGAARAAAAYKSMQTDAANARAQATALHDRNTRLHSMLVNDAVRSYQTGRTATDDISTRDLMAAAARADDAATRAEMQIGELVAQQQRAKADYDRFAAQYAAAQQTLSNLDKQLKALAKQRANALADAQQAKSGDLAQHRQTITESGQLGAQIRAASAQLAASGRTVQGTGSFAPPSSSPVITSAFGMRFHPILHYTKLHTGTDFAVGDGFARAADSGRVLFTIVSVAYGNFTVIDHGTINGQHITTAYAHQAKFLVKPGEVVAKGQKIGIIGATGYATGPHLHFEVRDDGAVVDPMTWLR
jgi:murein DD-endopeptidase MepM/ murein hydrolase activator NlpD